VAVPALNLPLPNEYKRVEVYRMGEDHCQLVITEYFVLQGTKRIQTRLTIKTSPAFGRPWH